MKPPFVHRGNDEKRSRNWLPDVFGVLFFLVFGRDRSYLSGRLCAFSVTSKVCRVYVSGLFCSSGGLSDIKGDVHLGDVAHIRRYGRRTNNNKLRKRLCRRIHERRPIVDSAGSSAFLTPLSFFFSSHPFTCSIHDLFCLVIGWTCVRHEMLSLCRLFEDSRDNSVATLLRLDLQLHFLFSLFK